MLVSLKVLRTTMWMKDELINIGKVTSFKDGYIYVRINYSNFLKFYSYLKLGVFLGVSSNKGGSYLVGQLVDIYDVIFNQKENEITVAVTNIGDITSMERDIYLFLELKIKPLFEFSQNNFYVFNENLPIILGDVFIINDYYKIVTDFISSNNEKYVFNLPILGKVKINGLVFTLGFNNLDIKNLINPDFNVVFCSENNNKLSDYDDGEVVVLDSSLFIKHMDKYSINQGSLFIVNIKNRMDLMKLVNSYIFPDFVIGRKMLKIDYDLLSRILVLKNDYLSDFFYYQYYIIHRGVIFTVGNHEV